MIPMVQIVWLWGTLLRSLALQTFSAVLARLRDRGTQVGHSFGLISYFHTKDGLKHVF
jgi:hypothetical protein